MLLHDNTALSVWVDRPIDRPLSQDVRRFAPGFRRPDYFVDALLAFRNSSGPLLENSKKRPGYKKQPLRDGSTFWEMSFASSPRSVWEALNGIEAGVVLLHPL
jgi:hypothetical protein